jgi:hypothetical protein
MRLELRVGEKLQRENISIGKNCLQVLFSIVNLRKLKASPKGFGNCLKNRGRVETQPRCKIQYPMKNHCKDAKKYSKRCTVAEIILQRVFLRKKAITINPALWQGLLNKVFKFYFF